MDKPAPETLKALASIVNKAIDKYAKSPSIRALINLVPTIGGSLDVLLTEKASKWKEERLNKLLTELDKKVENLDLKADELHSRITSEDFYDSLMKAAESSIKTRHNDKIHAFANILTNEVKGVETNELNSELSVILLDNLSIEELEYLKFIIDKGGKFETIEVSGEQVFYPDYKKYLEKTGNEEYIPEECKFNFNKIFWKFLMDKNIIHFDSPITMASEPYYHTSNNYSINGTMTYQNKKSYALTDFGKEFVEWITESH